MSQDSDQSPISSGFQRDAEQSSVLDISWAGILKVAVAFVCFYVLYLVRDVLVWFIFAFIISVLFNPAINFLQKMKIPRVIATIFIYVGLFGFLGYFIYLVAPIFIAEIQQFTELFPQYFSKMAPSFKVLGIKTFENFEVFTQAIQEWLIKASANIASGIFSLFGGIFSTVTIFAIAIFLSLEKKGVEKAVLLLSPKKNEDYILDLLKRCETKVAGWFGTRILSCIFVGLLSYLSLKIFGVEYAFILGIFAGVMDIVPILGPILAGLMIAGLTALDSSLKALFVLIAFILIQQVEGNILTPILTKKFIGLPSVLVLIALAIGGELGGILGAILAIPLAGILFEFLKDFLRKKKEETASLQ